MIPVKRKKRTLAQSESGRSEDQSDQLLQSPDAVAASMPVMASSNVILGLISNAMAYSLSPVNRLPEPQATSLPLVPIVSSGSAWTSQSTFPSALPALPMGYVGSYAFDPRLLLFQPYPSATLSALPFLLDQSMWTISLAMTQLEAQLSANMLSERLVSQTLVLTVVGTSEQLGSNAIADERVGVVNDNKVRAQGGMKVDSHKNGGSAETERRGSSQKRQSTVPQTDEDVTEYVLSSLSLTGRSKITDQEFALERASLTDKEREENLADLFGTCAPSITVEARSHEEMLITTQLTFYSNR